MDLKQLRALRKSSSSSLDKIARAVEQSGSKDYTDEKLWKVEPDKAGNGSAVIRFLPETNEDNLPWVKIYTHGFQGPTGKWYIDNCLTTLGKSDPVVDHCNELWNTGLESDKKIARDRKRKISYYANVLVVSDPKHPENEGQVKVFRFGAKIFEKITNALQPTFEDEKPIDVFNPFEGANFKLRMMKKDGFANFDRSEFDGPSELADGDEEEMIRILNARHDIQSYVAEDQFKSYDDLKKKLDSVLNPAGANAGRAEDDEVPDYRPEPKREAKPPIKEKAEPKQKAVSEDDDDMAFFKGLVDDDEPTFDPDDEIPF